MPTPCLIILIVVALVLLISLLLYSNSRKKAKEKLTTKKYAKDWLSAIAERKPVKSNVGSGSNKPDIVSIPLSPNDLYKTELVPCNTPKHTHNSELPIRGRKAYVDEGSSRSHAWDLATGWNMANSPHSSDRDVSQTPSSYSKPSRCNEPSYDTSSSSCSGSSHDSGSSDSGSSSCD